MALCRLECLILAILKDEDYTNYVRAATINEILELEQQSKVNTIQKKLKRLVELGYVSIGAKAGRAFTYYISNEGIKQLSNTITNKTEVDNTHER